MVVGVFAVSLTCLRLFWLRLSIVVGSVDDCHVVIFDVDVMSVGHLNPCPAIVLGMYSSSIGNDDMLFEIFCKSFRIGLSNILLMSSSDAVR